MKMKKIGLRTALKKMGASEIELKSMYGNPEKEWSGFFIGNGGIFKENQLYYVHYNPNFSYMGKKVMYRTAEHRKDYTGGINMWGFEESLKRIGYYI
jgi:hypothetical protein